MSLFDWSRAPTNAIGAFFNAKDAFFFVETKQPSRYGGTEGFAGDKCNGEQYHVFPEYWSWEERPAQWDGQGLPPVGTVCEVDIWEEWPRCEIIAHFQQRCGVVAAFTVEVVDGAKSLDAYGAEFFRPIRTAEQIAAEEREAAIEELRKLLSRVACDDYHAAVAMIDAGYRKQVAP